MAVKKIQSTKNYRMFQRSELNRETVAKTHRKLMDSMQKYGFLSCFPIVCRKDDKGTLRVQEGQHRLLFAETLGLPVYWVEEEVAFNIAEINCTPKVWKLKDFAMTFANIGKKDYSEGVDFAKQHGLPIGTAFSLLAGNTNFSNIQEAFVDGRFVIKDRMWADLVASVYSSMTAMSSEIKNARFIEACMAVARVKDFDVKRLLSNAARCREKLVSYSTRDAYLDMIEDIYNFHRAKLVPLKVEAVTAMRQRSAAVAAKKKAKAPFA